MPQTVTYQPLEPEMCYFLLFRAQADQGREHSPQRDVGTLSIILQRSN
jgi:hypothetical protein